MESSKLCVLLFILFRARVFVGSAAEFQHREEMSDKETRLEESEIFGVPRFFSRDLLFLLFFSH